MIIRQRAAPTTRGAVQIAENATTHCFAWPLTPDDIDRKGPHT